MGATQDNKGGMSGMGDHKSSGGTGYDMDLRIATARPAQVRQIGVIWP